MTGNPKIRAALAALVAAAASAAFAAPASAGVLTRSATDCDAPVISHPFARWGDQASYKPVSDGGFEDGAGGWTLTGGATGEDGHVRKNSDEKSREREERLRSSNGSSPLT